MNIFALLAFTGGLFFGLSNGLYLYTRQTAPGGTSHSLGVFTDKLALTSEEVILSRNTPETPPSDNDEGIGGLATFDDPTLLAANSQSRDGWDDESSIDTSPFIDEGGQVGTLGFTGYASSPYVPFRVQVKARDSILNSEIGKVPNSEVSELNDALAISGPVSLDLASAAGVPVPGGSVSADDGTVGTDSALLASSINAPLPGQDTLPVFTPNSDLVDSVESIIGNGKTDSALALAPADVPPSAGISNLAVQNNNGDLILPSVQLTDPVFAGSSGSTANSLFLSADSTLSDGSPFVDPGSTSGSVVANGVTAASSSIFLDNDPPNKPNDQMPIPGTQDESFVRNSDPTGPVDNSDPCNLITGFTVPNFQCTSAISRTVLAPYKKPTIPRPDSDIGLDDIN